MFLTPIPPLGLGLATTFTLDLGLETKLGDGGPVGAELGPATAGCGACDLLVFPNKTSLIAFAACAADLTALGGLFPNGSLFVRGIIKCF